jgi:DNA helicase-2/ATP-dependent DNA helicase PcrA
MEFCSPSRFLKDIDRDLLDIGGYGSRKTSYPERRQPTYTTPRNFRPIERPASSFRPVERQSFRPVNTAQPQVSQRTVTTSSPTFPTSNNNATFNAGDQVIHERFGEGVITAIEGAGDSTKAVVEFAYSGTKKLLLKFAKLKKK